MILHVQSWSLSGRKRHLHSKKHDIYSHVHAIVKKKKWSFLVHGRMDHEPRAVARKSERLRFATETDTANLETQTCQIFPVQFR